MGAFPEAKILLIVAAIITALSVSGAIAGMTGKVMTAGDERADDVASNVGAAIGVVSYPGGGVYNDTEETVTVYVQNVGARTLAATPAAIDLLIDGEYTPIRSVTVLNGSEWKPGTVVRIRANVSLTINATHRVVVRVDGAEATFTFDAFRPPSSEGEAVRDEIVYTTESGRLHSLETDGTVYTYDATAAAIGPKEIDFDDDGRLEIPYVNGSGVVKLIDAENETTTLATGADTTNTLVGVGDWRGETSVFYVNESDGGYIYRVRPGSSPERVIVGGSPVAAKAIAGVGDYNDDGDADLVFAGTSAVVKYVDGGTIHSTGVTVGTNNNVGIGAPREFDGAAPIRVPIVDGSQNVALLDSAGDATTLTGDGPASKAPVAGIDWTGTDNREIVFVNASGYLKYVTLDGDVRSITDDDGDPITADADTGVA